MSDSEFSDLFAKGTAPERDPEFVLLVAAGIGRVRLRNRLFALAGRATGVLVLAVAMFVAISLIKPLLVQLVDGSPQFMGVPVPVVLGGLVAGLALRGWHHLRPLGLFAPPSP